jgi:HEXXH motif-containing protein
MTGQHLVLCDGPGGDARAFRSAYARYLANCCRQFLTLGGELPTPLRAAHGRVADLVRHALSLDEGLMLHCFAAPNVGTPLRCLHLRDDLPAFQARIDDTVAALMPHLLFEMALRGLIGGDADVVWEHGAPPLASLVVGGEVVPPAGATGLVFSATRVAAVAGGTEIAHLPLDDGAIRSGGATPGGFRFERRYRPLGEVTHFATIDRNPLATFETHPDKSGNPVDLGGRPEAEWIDSLEAAFGLVETFLPKTFAEMRMMLHAVIPVGYDETRHLSASYREAIGTMYLTLHPHAMTMAEAVLHEFQHNKFNVASDSAEYLENAFDPRYKSPIRPDPRPLWGILLAVHAFLPVAELYRRMRDAGHPFAERPDFEPRMSEIDLKNHEGMEMLRAHARFTEPGIALFGDLEALERRHLAERTARGLSNVPTEVHVP